MYLWCHSRMHTMWRTMWRTGQEDSPYVGTRVEGKNLASSGKHHSSLCFWYLGLHCFLGHATASQLGCIFGRYPGVIIHTDRDMNYATIKYDDGEVEEAVLAKYIRRLDPLP